MFRIWHCYQGPAVDQVTNVKTTYHNSTKPRTLGRQNLPANHLRKTQENGIILLFWSKTTIHIPKQLVNADLQIKNHGKRPLYSIHLYIVDSLPFNLRSHHPTSLQLDPCWVARQKQITTKPYTIEWTKRETTRLNQKCTSNVRLQMSLWRGNISRTQKRNNGLFWPLHFNYDIKITHIWKTNHTIHQDLWRCCKRCSWDVRLSHGFLVSYYSPPSTLASWISRISCWKIGFHWRNDITCCQNLSCVYVTHTYIWVALLQHIGLFQEPRETCELMKVYSDWIWMNVYKQATRAELSAARRKTYCPQNPYIPLSLASTSPGWSG